MYENIRKLREIKILAKRNGGLSSYPSNLTYSDYELGNLNIPVSILCNIADFYQSSIDGFLVGRTSDNGPLSAQKEAPPVASINKPAGSLENQPMAYRGFSPVKMRVRAEEGRGRTMCSSLFYDSICISYGFVSHD